MILMKWFHMPGIFALAKKEHRTSFFGQINSLGQALLGESSPMGMLYFDREDSSSLPSILKKFREGLQDKASSLLIHSEGTRSLSASDQVQRVSSVVLDFAMEAGLPVVPVRLSGGLPRDAPHRRDPGCPGPGEA